MWLRVNDKVKVSEGQIRQWVAPTTLPAKLTPEILKKYRVVPATFDPRPKVTNLQRAIPGEFVKRGDDWFCTWLVTKKFETTEEEEAYLDALAEQAEEQARIESVATHKSASDMNKMTVESAEAYIDKNVTDAGTAKVLKKMLPFILT